MAALLAASGCGREASPPLEPQGGFPGVELAAHDGAAPELRRGCATERCLYVYVAPWCGVCEKATPMLLELAAWLRRREVEVAFISGLDSERRLRKQAALFGPGALIDPRRRVPLKGGVPQFVVTDSSGTILNRHSGVPFLLESPVPEDALAFIAGYHGLVRRGTPEEALGQAFGERLLRSRGARR